MTEDVTKLVYFGENDGDTLPLTKCICGHTFPVWREIVSIYEDHPWTCPHCHVKLIFKVGITVLKVI